MDSYYQFSPLFTIKSPIVVTGRNVRDAKRTAQYVTAQTGLTLSDVDDWFLHHAEKSPTEVSRTNGDDARRSLEGRLLDRALKRTPCGVIFLDPGAFKTADVRRVLDLKAHVVFIETNEKTETELESMGRSPSLWGRLLQKKTPMDHAKASADTLLEVGQRDPLGVAQIIIRSLKDQDGPHRVRHGHTE